MNRFKLLAVSMIALFTAAMAGCGGGGDGGTTPGGATPGVSRGVITSLGSVFVNGVEFSTTSATVKIDDNPSTADLLKPGMVVTVKGTFDDRTGTATEIEFDDNLQGPISAINPTAKTITVLGKTVKFEDNITRVNDDTAKVFTGAGFVVGESVSVSGFEDNTGAIRAMRIDDSPESEIEVKGTVSLLGASSFTLTSGASTFTVNFTASLLPATVTDGKLVEVRGTLAGTTITALATARGVTLEDDGLDDNVNKVEVEGVVISGNSSSFVINGVTVTTSGTTEFENGLPSDLIPNVRVEAEGPMVNGVLQAVKVSFRSNIRIQGLVTVKTGAGQAGSLTVLGKTVTTTVNTDFRDFSGNPQSLDTIIAGTTRVEVRGFLDLTGTLVATRLDVTNDTKEIIMSPVIGEDATAGTVTLLFGNTLVTTNAQTQFQSDNDDINDNDTPITRQQFFDGVIPGTTTAPGTVVKARLVTGSFVADELEIEGDR